MGQCLTNVLKTLKESSKEAVENIDKFNTFKEYMHIKRNVQDELIDVIQKCRSTSTKQLILVCGSVGDGKSHLISYLKNKEQILDEFYVHNDATESLTPNMTSIETLDYVLKGFRDDYINNGEHEHVIIAVNLGMLNNFIDSEMGKFYGQLKEYVEKQGILESYTSEYAFDPNSNFQHINFSDYHLFQLTKEGDHVDSAYIKALINKIVGENIKNPFYECYQESCSKCELSATCPIKQNFELLEVEQVQDAIVDLLVEAMLKHKILISTRSLLSFFYDIMVGKNFSKEHYLTQNKEKQVQIYLKTLLPNLLYGHVDTSELLQRIDRDDPLGIRSESVDEMIIKFNILDDSVQLLEECLNGNVFLQCMKEIDINSQAKQNKETKQLLLKLFIRAYKLLGKEEKLNVTDSTYIEFINSLYYFNAGKVKNLKGLYSNFQDAIFKWNGDSSKNTVNIAVGQKQFEYKISQTLKIEEYIDLSMKVNDKDILDKFIPYISLAITNENSTSIEKIDVDYALFKLIRDIKNGYRPNVKDKNKFISFANIVERIYNYGDKVKEVIIERKNEENAEKFVLKHTAFGYEFERIK